MRLSTFYDKLTNITVNASQKITTTARLCVLTPVGEVKPSGISRIFPC